MHAVSPEELHALLAKAGIEMAPPKTKIGAQLSYRPYARRTVVVQFGEHDTPQYVSQTLLTVLSIEVAWLLTARYGSVAELISLESPDNVAALRFDAAECEVLERLLRPGPPHTRTIVRDLYVVGASGQTLVTWDHHTFQDGLSIEFSDVSASSVCSRNLMSLVRSWRSTLQTANPAIDRSAQQRSRCWVPVPLRGPAPGHCERWAP